jgi:hypothetical protein
MVLRDSEKYPIIFLKVIVKIITGKEAGRYGIK